MGSLYSKRPVGLGLRAWRVDRSRRNGEAYSLSGGVGLPSGLFQKPLEPEAMSSSSLVAILDEAEFEPGNATRADQKLVSATAVFSGKSKINRPTSACEQKPCLTASEVQTYVLCWVASLSRVRRVERESTHRQPLLFFRRHFAQIFVVSPLVYDHSQLALGFSFEGN